MTNAEKYLKDEASVEEFLNAVIEHCSKSAKNSIETFLKAPIQPTLTEDEKVILRNIDKKYNTIGRNADGDLVVGNNGINNGINWSYADIFNELFQFIREEEEYSTEELLKGE